ncbi:MAG: GNAT family N-acetyltransferase/peptidase C39 family protein [Trueperaceae bacterium]
MRVRRATRGDLDVLVRLEAAFPGDRLSRASFARFIEGTTTDVWVATAPDDAGRDVVVGDAVVNYRRGFQAARLYSLVTAPAWQGRGVGRALMAAVEEHALERGLVSVRLEVRADNVRAIDLYRRLGYVEVGLTHAFYEDHSDALRMRKRLRADAAQLLAVPYYPQSLAFTCGPASLMMALRALGHAEPLGQAEELALWREATTVFMLAGHGGTSAHGLAVAALRRGFAAEVWVDQAGPPFLDTVRSAEKKRVIELAHAGFVEALAHLGGRVRVGDFGADDVVEQLRAGRVPLVLVSGARLYAERVPHWVVATGFDDDHLYVHDPHLPEGAQRADGVHLPLRRADFARVARYGRARHRALVVVWRPGGGRPPAGGLTTAAVSRAGARAPKGPRPGSG